MLNNRTQTATDSVPAGDDTATAGSFSDRLTGRFRRTSRVVNRLALLLMFVFFASVLISIAAPQRYRFGPFTASFEGVVKPLLEWFAAYVVWRITYDGFGAWLKRWLAPLERQADEVGAQLRRAAPRLRDQWQCWSWRERLVLIAVGCQVLLVLRSWEIYPRQLAFERGAAEFIRQFPFHHPHGHAAPTLEYFCQTICAATPPDARILFYGRTPAVRVAYEVYPRRVFMLPQDYTALASAWHVQPWCQQLSPDPHETYWQRSLPRETVPAASFIREHGITHVASFDEYDMNLCRVEPVK